MDERRRRSYSPSAPSLDESSPSSPFLGKGDDSDLDESANERWAPPRAGGNFAGFSYSTLRLGAVVGGLAVVALASWHALAGSFSDRSIFSEASGASRYSWHQCYGGAEYANSGSSLSTRPWKERSCHFKNVCVRLRSLEGLKHDTNVKSVIELEYFRSPLVLGGPRLWSLHPDTTESWLSTDRDHDLTQMQHFEAMPSDRPFVSTPSVLMGAFWPLNFGHAIGDDLLPAFRLLRQFGLVRRDNYYVFHQSCTQRGGPRGCKNVKGLLGWVTKQPYQELGGELFPDSNSSVCFADLVMGPNGMTMRVAGERVWPDFVQHMKAQAGISLRPLKKHRVVVIHKTGRRTWLNYEAVREHIEKAYGVDAMLVDPAELSVVDQLKLLDGTTVLITPPGGVSFSSVFLHKHASAIYVEWWSEAHQRSFPMDQEVYVWNEDVHPLFYPTVRKDLSLDLAAVPEEVKRTMTTEEVWQGYANVTINLDRLDLFLREAFLHTSQSLGMALPPGLRGKS